MAKLLFMSNKKERKFGGGAIDRPSFHGKLN